MHSTVLRATGMDGEEIAHGVIVAIGPVTVIVVATVLVQLESTSRTVIQTRGLWTVLGPGCNV